jgi:hypothetical protein
MKGKHEYSSRANLVENEGKNEDREDDRHQEDKGEKKASSMDISPMAGGQPITGYNIYAPMYSIVDTKFRDKRNFPIFRK